MVIGAATFTFDPLISSTLWFTLAVCAVVVALLYALRKPAGVSWRRWATATALSAAGGAAVLVVLLNPSWLETIPPPAGRPLLTILLDSSASMAAPDVGNRARFDAGREFVDSAVATLGASFDIQVKTFDAHAKSTDAAALQTLRPEGELTDLAAALSESLAWDRPQGQAVLLLSDGVHNGAGGVEAVLDAARTARSMATPVSVLPLGGAGRLDDISVSVPRPQELGYVGQRLTIPVKLRQRGRLGDEFVVRLRSADGEIAQQTVRMPAEGETAAAFELTARKPGVFRYEVAVAASRPEAVTGNNTATLVLRVSRDPIRVLVLEGKPYWDTKFLLRTLSADAMLEVDSFVRVATDRFLRRELRLQPAAAAAASAGSSGPEKTADADELPGFRRTDDSTVVAAVADDALSARSLSRYQVIVLGRDAEVFLHSAVVERLRNWVAREGGSLVCFRGAPVATLSQQLAAIMPVRWSPGAEARFHPHLTERGLAADWLSTAGKTGSDALVQLPTLAMQAQPGRPSPLTVVLAEGSAASGPPVVSYQPYGAGRAVTVEGAGMWRWAFLAPQHKEQDEVYAGLWQSLIRWLVASVGLAPGQDLLLRTDRVAYRVGESVSMQVLAREDVWPTLPPLQLYRDDELLADRFLASPVGDEPGVFQVNLGRLAQGRYRAQIVGGGDEQQQQVAAFDVLPFLNERLDISARPDILSRVAQETGGAVLSSVSASDFQRRYQQHLSQTRPEQTRRYSAWDRWWVLSAILVLWVSAWTVRRMGGLV